MRLPVKKRVQQGHFLHNAIIDIMLILLASILFAASFPNAVFPSGLGFIIGIALFPVGILIQRTNKYKAILYGFLYGNLAYLLFNIWLGKFSPTAFLIVPPIYGGYFMLVFFLLRLAYEHFGKYTFLMQSIIWLMYEYWRSVGFLGYTFGTLGYAWAFYPSWIQSAQIFGVWGITFFIAILSFLFAQAYDTQHSASIKIPLIKIGARLLRIPMAIKHYFYFIMQHTFYRKSFMVYAGIFIVMFVYGIISISIHEKEYAKTKTTRIALMQHVTDPWKGGIVAYRTGLQTLIAQSKSVLESENPPEIVVWSETAFVPSISYHTKYRESPVYVRLINELYNFLAQYPDTEFLIGNGEGVKLPNEQGILQRENYNASLFFEGSEKKDSYYKINLVPFTEYFPYKNSVPKFYAFLEKQDVHFWLPGEKYTVFEGKTANFSTPICFEDGFGVLNTKFVKNGADILINITNDAWSGVEMNAMQHLQMSIMRAVENKRSVVRSANSGMTAVINPSGRITAMLPSFTQAVLIEDVPVYNASTTFYTKFNDWFIVFMFGIGIIGIIIRIIKNKKSHHFTESE